MLQGIDRVLHDFLVESQENLERLDQEFVLLEQHPDNKELVADIFRTIHSIKGSAGFLNLARLEELAHATEEVLGQIRAGACVLTEPIMTCLLQAVDSIRSILFTLKQTGVEGEHELQQLIGALRQIAEGQAPVALTQIAQADSGLSGQPTPVPSQEGQPTPVPSQEGNISPRPVGEGPGVREHSAIPSEQIESNGKNGVPDAQSADPLERVLASVEDTRIHVDVNVLDRLMNLTGELVLARNQIVRLSNESGMPVLQHVAQRLDGMVSELQETMMKTRMQELRKVFGLFPRLVRDVSKQHGKEVTLKMEGHQIELDRTLLEELKMPLMHLVRNAIDHGIESPEVRHKLGKPLSGTITIRAYHDSGQVNIEIADDGAGINPEQIKRKAIEQGLLAQAQAEHVSAETLLDLIFRPGFSTAESVTSMSGRGVGMDVVKRHLNRIGGVVEITTEHGQGTTFKLHIPMTLAIIPGLLVSARDRHFVIPQRNLEELVQLDEKQKEAIKAIADAEVYRWRTELLPLIRLNTVLQIQPPEKGQRDAGGPSESPPGEGQRDAIGTSLQNPHIIVLSTGERRFGMVVDHVSDTEDIVVKPLGRHIKQAPCYDGVTILGDGNVALILNVRGLFTAGRFDLKEIQRAEQSELARQQQAEDSASKEHRQTIVLFKAGAEEYYGAPLAFVERIETFPAAQIETSGGREVLQYRGEVLPLMRIESLLHLTAPPARPMVSLLVFSVEKDIGLVAQQVINTVEIDTQIDTKTFQQKGVLGTTIVEGHSVLILDIHGLIELAYPHWYQQFFVSRLREEERREIRVLLVEDSKFFMNIEKSYLESAGYQVITAEHGNAALERLAESPIDVVVTDIDMPYCNGYELTKAIKAHADWKQIPVMAVTALSGKEDRQKGMEVGVDEYKIKLDRDEVLSALEQLIIRKRKRGERP